MIYRWLLVVPDDDTDLPAGAVMIRNDGRVTCRASVMQTDGSIVELVLTPGIPSRMCIQRLMDTNTDMSTYHVGYSTTG